MFKGALVSSQTRIQWTVWALSVQVGRDDDLSPPSSAQIKNGWSYTSIPQNRMALQINFTFYSFYQRTSPGLRHMYPFRNKARFYGEELLAPRPTPKLQDHLLSSVRHSSFNIIAATLHIGGRSSIHNNFTLTIAKRLWPSRSPDITTLARF